MRNLIRFIFSIILSLSLATSSISFATTDAPVSRGTENIFPISQDIVMYGVVGSNSIFFNKSSTWNFNSTPYIDVKFKITPLKARSDSTLTILLNNTPIDSIYLSDKTGEFSSIIQLPSELIRNGLNTITFSPFHTLTDELCTDDINPGNWLSIKKDSYIHLEYSYIQSDQKISNFPYPYILSDDPNPSNSVIVIPTTPTDTEKINALRLGHILSNLSTKKSISLKIISYEEYLQNYSSNKNAIFIAEKKNVFPMFSSLQEEIPPQYGYIRQLQPQSNPNLKYLFISGDIFMSINALENESARLQMKDSVQFVDFEKKPTKIPSPQNTFTLKDFGFTDITVEGIFNKNIPYFVQLPGYRRVGKNSNLTFDLSYSQFMDFKNSNLTLYIDNKPVYSNKLHTYKTKDSAFESYSFKIPDEFSNRRSLNFELRCYLAVDKEKCGLNKQSLSNLWLTVRDSSKLDSVELKTSSPVFDDFPDNFVNNSTSKNLGLLLEKYNDFSKLNLYSHILNHTFRNRALPDKVELISSISNNFNGSVISITSPDKDKFPSEFNSNALLPFDKSYWNFKSSPDIPILSNPYNNLLSLQLMNLPSNKDSMILYITSSKSENLDFFPIFLEKQNISFLNGNVILFNQEKPLSSLYLGSVESEISQISTIATEQKVEKKISESQQQIIIITSIFILTFLSIFIYILKKERKNKK